MYEISEQFLILAAAGGIIVFMLLLTAISSLKHKLAKYSKIEDVKKEVERIKTHDKLVQAERLKEATRDLNRIILGLDNEIKAEKAKKSHIEATLRGVTKALSLENTKVSNVKAKLKNLEEELHILVDRREFIEVGFYEPLLNLEESHIYKSRLDKIRRLQKTMIRDKTAFVCNTKWEVGGSKVEGRKMTSKNIKLGLTAFNNQCDNIILSTKWNNYDRSVNKLDKSRDSIDKLLETNDIHITSQYFNLKLEELELAFKYEEKTQQEKEEQKRNKRADKRRREG